MLARLVTALHKQELQHDTLEAHHSILSTIMHLAGKPIKIDYQPSAAALACLQGIRQGKHVPLCVHATSWHLSCPVSVASLALRTPAFVHYQVLETSNIVAEGEADDTCSEASALSHWDELDGQASSSSLSDWGDHNTEAGSAEDSSPQISQIPQDPAAEKRSRTAKMLQLGQLDTKIKAARLPFNGSGVRRGHKHHRSLFHLYQRMRLAVSGRMIPVMVVSKSHCVRRPEGDDFGNLYRSQDSRMGACSGKCLSREQQARA